MGKRFSIEAIFKARDHMSRVIGKIAGRTERMADRSGRALRRLDRQFGKVTQGIKRGAIGLAAVGATAGFALRDIGMAGAEFEQSITNVGAVMLKRRSEIGELEQAALSLGRSTRFTATQAADAMEIMARAGFSQQDILGGIRGVLDAAAASGLEIAEVADHVSNALKGMGLETK